LMHVPGRLQAGEEAVSAKVGRESKRAHRK